MFRNTDNADLAIFAAIPVISDRIVAIHAARFGFSGLSSSAIDEVLDFMDAAREHCLIREVHRMVQEVRAEACLVRKQARMAGAPWS